MKKLVSIICIVAMLMSFGTVSYAKSADLFSMEYSSYDSGVTSSVELNKPLDILSLVEEVAGFDVQYIVEELLNTVVVSNVQCEISEDYLKAKIYMSYNLKMPVNVSEDLKFAADVTGHMWMEYDFSSVDNAKYIIIVKNPVNEQYIYIDAFDERFNSQGLDMKTLLVESYKALDIKGYVEEVKAIAEKEYGEHAVMTELEDGYTKISFTNDQLIDFTVDYIVGIMGTEYMKNSLSAEGVEVEGFVPDELAITMAKATVKSLSIFSDEDAFTIKYKADKEGRMEEAEERLHIQFNIVELAKVLGASEEDMYPFTKENSDIDITFVTNMTYKDINTTVVNMPLLTNDNRVNLFDLLEDVFEQYEYYDGTEDFNEEEEMYQSEKFWDYAQGRMDRGGMYVNMNDFLLSAQWDDDNLTGEVVLNDNAVDITLTSDNFGTVKISGNLKEDGYLLNETQLWGRKPFVKVSEYNWDTYEAEERVYVNIDVLKYVLGAQVESMEVYLLDENGISLTEPEYYFYIVRPNPAYVGE